MADHEVVIAGAGPTGLMLAGELKLAGVDVVIVERRVAHDLQASRAGGLHARSIEMLDQRGIAERFLKEGQIAQVAGLGATRFDISAFPSRHPYGLALWQRHIERILLGWVEELGVPILRGREVTGFAESSDGIEVRLDDGVLTAQYLVGCDGGRSAVRKLAGIEFAGWEASVSHLIAEVEVTSEPDYGARNDQHGLHGLTKMDDGRVRVLVTEPTLGRTDEPTLADLSAALKTIYGTDYGVHSPVSVGRFTDMARQAVSYRKGRVLLAGDAAHVHYPAGGQGLNIGLQDAVNLGWKLAEVVQGVASETLLNSYHDERHPVAARVLRNTLAAVALGRQDDRSKALAEVVGELLGFEEPRLHMAGVMSGLGLHYDFGAGHPLLGRRMPISTWSRRTARCGCSRCCMMASPCCSISAGCRSSTRRDGRIGCARSAPPMRANGICRCLAWSARRGRCWCGPTAMWRGSAKAAATDWSRR